MTNLKETKRIVEKILMENKTTRNSDQLLYVAYYQRIAPHVKFIDFYKSPKIYGGASEETVSRCRRKIQEEIPELKDAEVEYMRNEQEIIFHNFFRK